MSRVLFVLADGMRPDAMSQCGHPLFDTLTRSCAYSLTAQTVMPSVTLPCHMSLFHSVSPDRHGILTNTWVPQVRPVSGLYETLSSHGKSCAMYYDWEPLRDISRPGSLTWAAFARGPFETTDRWLTECAERCILEHAPDCVFLYLGYPDGAGHDRGWMSEEYLHSVRASLSCVEHILSVLPPDYRFFLMADHGGHARRHGDDVPEDMTIPLFARGPEFVPGSRLENATIMDVAPTIARLLDVPADPDWEGKCLY